MLLRKLTTNIDFGKFRILEVGVMPSKFRVIFFNALEKKAFNIIIQGVPRLIADVNFELQTIQDFGLKQNPKCATSVEKKTTKLSLNV